MMRTFTCRYCFFFNKE